MPDRLVAVLQQHDALDEARVGGCGSATARSAASRPRDPSSMRSSPANEMARGSRARSSRTGRTSPSPRQRHVQVRPQVGGQVVVRGRQEHADAGPRDQLAQVERQHLGERAVEVGGELVGHEPSPGPRASARTVRCPRSGSPSMPVGTDTAARRTAPPACASSSRASDSPHAASSFKRSSTGPAGHRRAARPAAPAPSHRRPRARRPAARNSDDFPLPDGPVNRTRSPGRTSSASPSATVCGGSLADSPNRSATRRWPGSGAPGGTSIVDGCMASPWRQVDLRGTGSEPVPVDILRRPPNLGSRFKPVPTDSQRYTRGSR